MELDREKLILDSFLFNSIRHRLELFGFHEYQQRRSLSENLQHDATTRHARFFQSKLCNIETRRLHLYNLPIYSRLSAASVTESQKGSSKHTRLWGSLKSQDARRDGRYAYSI